MSLETTETPSTHVDADQVDADQVDADQVDATDLADSLAETGEAVVRPTLLGRTPEIMLGMAVGSLIVAVAFAGSRSSRPWATVLFWLGQVIIYAVPAGFLLFRKSILWVEATAIALLMPLTTYLVLLYYSPTRFLFLDEFSHVQTAQTILATHHLFHHNTALAPSPQFPGLEIVTTAIVDITHLSLIASGLIVAGTAHVLIGLAVFFLVAHLTRNAKIAAVATVVYATSPHFQFFDSYFIYETMALPFFILLLLAVARMLDEKGPAANAWGLAAVACAAATTVSHHVTGFALVAVLFGFSVIQYFLPREMRSRRLPVLFVVVTAMVATWDLLIATSTWPYFKPVVEALIGEKPYKPPHPLGYTSIFTSKLATGPTGAARPSDLALEYVSILIFIVLAPIGAWSVWKRRRDGMHAVTLGLAVGSLGIFGVVLIRVAAANGTVLAARSLTFVLIPLSFVTALLLCDRKPSDPPANKWLRRASRAWTPATKTAVVVVCAVGGIAGGYPNYYSRLPGPFLFSAFERSVDDHNLSAASWIASTLPPGGGLASDFFTGQMLGALGHEYDRKNVARIFLTTKFTTADYELIRTSHVQYVVIDRRMTRYLPTVGYYFAADPGRNFYSSPLPQSVVDKFDTIPGVSRIYDDGTIVIYDFKGAAHR
ncbi:MAG: hypothetical protein ABSF84_14545 [Acidimicrobiales bacterium]